MAFPAALNNHTSQSRTNTAAPTSNQNRGAAAPSTNLKRTKSAVKKSNNGVILLPRQNKYPQNPPSLFGQKKSMSKLTIDTTTLAGLSDHQPQQPQLVPSSSSSPMVPQSPAQLLQPNTEIHHTKSGAYQRIKKKTSSSNLAPATPVDSTSAEVSQRAREKKPEDGATSDTGTPTIKKVDPSKEKIVTTTRARSDSKSKVLKPGIKATPPAAIARQARGPSVFSQSGNPASDAVASSISNNRKLLLSINKGISPYTTVVPQVNVLIVEDNVINQKILETYLRKRKIRSSTANNGKEAIEKWKQGGFHLVLMDIQLPVMNGIKATKKIRQMETLNRIGVFSGSPATATAGSQDGGADQEAVVPAENIDPADVLDTKKFRYPVIIVALTASSSLADKSEALAAGCNDFLTKPVNLKWLEQKTIEWGCMQALIDFDGWKHWVSKEATAGSGGNASGSGGPLSATTSTGPGSASAASAAAALKRAHSVSKSATTVGNSPAITAGKTDGNSATTTVGKTDT